MKPVPFKEGDRFEFPYPFSRSTYDQMDGGDEDNPPTFTAVPSWKVGPSSESDGMDGCYSMADALGKCVLTVVSIHKPGKYPTRVFFTRTWITPDGKAFGKTKCRVTTVPTFLAMATGYMHDYELRGCKCDGCMHQNDHRKQGWMEAMEPALSRREGLHS
jgi:hypothetical protein